MSARILVAMVAVLATAACAAKRPAVTMPAPAFPAFEMPTVPPDLASRAPAATRRHTEAWAALQAGDPKGSRARFTEILTQAPDFYPSQTALGYVELALKDDRRAAERFARALEQQAGYVPALLGQAEAFDRLGRGVEAVGALESAAVAEPSRADIRQRLEVARLSAVEVASSQARRLANEGKLVEARQAYERALAVSPESVFLHRELAALDIRLGDLDGAEAQAREAVRLDPNDPLGYVVQADVLEASGRWTDAAAALRTADRLGAADVGARVTKLEERAALDALPEAYRAIPAARRVTRGELAALIAVRLPRLVESPSAETAPLVTDIGSHWARPWVLAVVRAGLMEVYANHTFQPGQSVTRSELASVVSRVLATIAARTPGAAKGWAGARQSFSDIGQGHLAYPAASVSVASGVMVVDAGGAFSPGRLVTGSEAIEVVTRLERLMVRTPKDAGV